MVLLFKITHFMRHRPIFFEKDFGSKKNMTTFAVSKTTNKY